ncbi:hypothetical protein F8154_11060 [Alkaliphilus pronyensis]|uniref:Uncharacterized protein n=1 Tax=Alkaliphilus pronyensis TaxID=1482732 RepID=A0A6I0EZX1_9FIRM|nr:hypothetical protein [Alkaliphilus pronyensis]KAB3532932.1 hypothetical protein F8154_11060 [Alkaliphilus pronyensis]
MAKKDERYYRKQYKNQKILRRDKETLKAMTKCHYLAKEHFDRMKFSNKSLNRFLKMGVIESVEKIDKHSNDTVQLYRLTDYGKDYYRREINPQESFYSSTGHEHDLRVADVYTELYSTGVPFEWKTERELQQDFKDRIDEIRERDYNQAEQMLNDYRAGVYSSPDFAYSIGGETVMVEVITGSGTYTESHIQAKTDFGNQLGHTVQFIK